MPRTVSPSKIKVHKNRIKETDQRFLGSFRAKEISATGVVSDLAKGF